MQLAADLRQQENQKAEQMLKADAQRSKSPINTGV